MIERILGVLGAALLAPAILVLDVLFRLLLGRPALLTRRCMGRFGEEFDLFKLDTCRSTYPDSAFFKWIRILGLDELPQLLNVAKGNMSFIGPRPETVSEYVSHSHSSYRRFRRRPGIIGLWQASRLRGGSLRSSWRLDLFYEARKCLALDAYIVAKTLQRILRDCKTHFFRVPRTPVRSYLHHLEATEGGTLKVASHLAGIPSVDASLLLFQRGSKSLDWALPEAPGVRVIPCSRFLPMRFMQCLAHSYLYFDSVRPSHVHAHSTVSGVICRILKPWFGFQVRYTPHCYAFTYPHRIPGLRAALYGMERLLACGDFIGIHVSRHEEFLHRKLDASAATRVVHLPADSFVPIDTTVGFASRILLVVGSDRPQKGYGILERIQEQIERDRLGFQIVVVGARGRAKKVRYVDWQVDMGPYFRMAFCLLNVSHSEGCSLAMVDALASGLPVIASDIPANRELLDGRGLLVEGRRPERYSAVLATLAGNRNLYESLHREGQAHAHALHSLQNFQAAFLRLYQEAGIPGSFLSGSLQPTDPATSRVGTSIPRDASALTATSK